MERRLSAILAADVVGYSRLMEIDEPGTYIALVEHRQQVFEPLVEKYGGRIFKLVGDAILAEFGSVVDAVQCAAEIQKSMAERNIDLPSDRQIMFRIGVNLGDVIIEEDDIYGDGINIAARLESQSEPGGVSISATVFDIVRNKLKYGYDFQGEQRVKNIEKPVGVYRLRAEGSKGAVLLTRRARWKKPAMVGGVAALAVLFLLFVWPGPMWNRAGRASIDRMSYPLPDKPSIAVLPFTNVGEDLEQEYFVDGMTYDLITDLSKLYGLFVIGQNSTFAYKGKPRNVHQVAEELGVRYLLEGSVRRVDNTVRINAQLIDATTRIIRRPT